LSPPRCGESTIPFKVPLVSSNSPGTGATEKNLCDRARRSPDRPRWFKAGAGGRAPSESRPGGRGPKPSGNSGASLVRLLQPRLARGPRVRVTACGRLLWRQPADREHGREIAQPRKAGDRLPVTSIGDGAEPRTVPRRWVRGSFHVLPPEIVAACSHGN
jgi:hypothetical protein